MKSEQPTLVACIQREATLRCPFNKNAILYDTKGGKVPKVNGRESRK
jgi:hypothetical protein